MCFMIEASKEQAQKLVLDVQGLRTDHSPKDIVSVAKRIHNIQIDTISVVSRSHNLIVFNRFPNYSEGQVWELEKDGKFFEYWSHAMCLMPMESFQFYAWIMTQMSVRRTGWYVKWGLENKDIVEQVYGHVKKNGATASAQLGEKQNNREGWWDWKSEKRALEYLMTIGRLMVSYRKGFQKYYDLTERVLPASVNSEPLSTDEISEYVIDTTLRSLGIADYRDFKTYLGRMPYRNIWKSKKSRIIDDLEELQDRICVPISIEGVKGDFYIHKEHADLIMSDFADIESEPVKLLTPFDNVLRERHYPKWLWDFDYSIECYTPKKNRKFGYFILPILDGIKFAGRLDAKVHRDKKLLEIKALYLESESLKTGEGKIRFKRGVDDFAAFHECDSIEIGKVVPKKSQKSYKELFQ